MKPYKSPSFYSVEIETESIATWGSIQFNSTPTDSYNDTPTEEMDMGNQTEGFDAPTYRSTLWGNN